jgi:photosystem II stability/assembly factor-like uncharacterized protein
MSAFDSSRLVELAGPTAAIYSDDLGETWKHMMLPESCAMVLDVHFIDADRGFLACASDKNVQDSSSLILATEDGGKKLARSLQGYANL